jgi:uncharacterized membrane protein YcaP (DUF421 family)
MHPIEWQTLLVPNTSLVEIFLRGSVVYLALFFMLRFLLKREAGTLSTTDLLLVVLIADASQNAMSSDYKSVPEGLLLVGTIVFWSFFFDFLGERYPVIGRLLHPPPLELVRNGRMIRNNMHKELITKEELMSQLREQGVEHLSEVKRAYMEGDGHISVIKLNGDPQPKRAKPTI